jgi:hypothetical protein
MVAFQGLFYSITHREFYIDAMKLYYSAGLRSCIYDAYHVSSRFAIRLPLLLGNYLLVKPLAAVHHLHQLFRSWMLQAVCTIEHPTSDTIEPPLILTSNSHQIQDWVVHVVCMLMHMFETQGFGSAARACILFGLTKCVQALNVLVELIGNGNGDNTDTFVRDLVYA